MDRLGLGSHRVKELLWHSYQKLNAHGAAQAVWNLVGGETLTKLMKAAQ